LLPTLRCGHARIRNCFSRFRDFFSENPADVLTDILPYYINRYISTTFYFEIYGARGGFENTADLLNDRFIRPRGNRILYLRSFRVLDRAPLRRIKCSITLQRTGRKKPGEYCLRIEPYSPPPAAASVYNGERSRTRGRHRARVLRPHFSPPPSQRTGPVNFVATSSREISNIFPAENDASLAITIVTSGELNSTSAPA